MNKFERVLSDDDLVDIFALGIGDLSAKPFNELVEVLEQAIISKLKAEQEPVAWRVHPFDYGVGVEGAYAITQQEDMKEVWERKSWKVTPLYAQPIPCVSPASDKPACVSESAESETQHHLSYLKRYQKWRRGEDKTMSEMGLAPKQIGEALDWLVGVVENHIADAGGIITPLAQRKIQTLLDEGEYLAIENATVLVNKQGHAAIVNKGGAFYWVDNEALAREFDGRGVLVDGDVTINIGQMIAPDGWQLVPIEPTPEMIQASDDSDIEYSKRNFGDSIHLAQSGYDHYKAMLAAAPKYTGEK